MRNLNLKQGVIFDEHGETLHDHTCEHYLNHWETPECSCGRTMCETADIDYSRANGLKFKWWCTAPECQVKRHKAQLIRRTASKTDLMHVGVPAFLLDCTIENFKPRKNLKTGKMKNWQKDAFGLALDPQGTILFTGDPGTGKSHLAVGILREVMAKGVQVYFKRSAELLIDLQATFHREEGDTSEMLLEQYLHYGFLILDDLGTEKPTDYAVMILGEIVNSRYSDNKPTIITSNLGLQEINDRLDPRIASRITRPEWRFLFSDFRNSD